jgi:hypothetical protein
LRCALACERLLRLRLRLRLRLLLRRRRRVLEAEAGHGAQRRLGGDERTRRHRLGAVDDSHEVGGALAHERRHGRAARQQLPRVEGRDARELDEDVVGHDVGRRLVFGARHRVAPEKQRLQNAHLLLAEHEALLLAKGHVRVLVHHLLRVGQQRHLARTLPRHGEQLRAAGALQGLVAHAVEDVEQEVRVAARVVCHLRGQRPLAPVGQLEALVGLKVAVVLEEVGERVLGELEHAGALARVKEIHHVHAKVALQPLHVHVGAVQHLDDARVGEHLVEDAHVVAQLQRVDEVVAAARGDLHQTHEALVAAVVVVLEVDRKLALAAQRLHQRVQFGFGVDPFALRLRQRPEQLLLHRLQQLGPHAQRLDLASVRVRRAARARWWRGCRQRGEGGG